jgi:hypothetical protein
MLMRQYRSLATVIEEVAVQSCHRSLGAVTGWGGGLQSATISSADIGPGLKSQPDANLFFR